MNKTLIILGGMGWLLAAPAHAAEVTGHEGHNMPSTAPAADGPDAMSWSYKGRNNPAPYTKDRWEMLPQPGNGMMLVTPEKLKTAERCRILGTNRSIMVDKATRSACGLPVSEAPKAGAAPAAGGHSGH